MTIGKQISLFLCAALLICVSACAPAEELPVEIVGEQHDNPTTSDDTVSDALTWEQQLHTITAASPAEGTVQKNRAWYEIFVYSFYDSNGDGIGDLNGIREMLDYIAYMGFDGIWLMPIHPSPTYHKYDVTDYYAIDPVYGTMEDMENLIAECNARGIALMLDLVLNHTSVEHEWFAKAKKALKAGELDNPYVSYYHFAKEKGNGQWQTATADWFYECQFWSGMPDLNLDDPGLKAELEQVMRFWLEKGISGFRLDAVREYETGNQEKNIQIMHWINDTVKAVNPDAYVVGEAWDTSMALFELYQSGIDSFFNFPFALAEGKLAKPLLLKNQSADDYAKALVAVEEAITAVNPNASDAAFFTNHDTARAAGIMRQQMELIKTAWGMNLLQSGNVFVYYGEEIGMSGSGKDENKRQPMQWTEARQSGMPYPPPNSESITHKFPPVVEQVADEQSLLQYVRKAIQLRKQYPAIANGRTSIVSAEGSDKTCVVQRTADNETIYLAYNLGADSVSVTSAALANAKISDGLYTAQTKAAFHDGALTLPPYSITILK